MKFATLLALAFLWPTANLSAQAPGSSDEQKADELVKQIQHDLSEIDRLLLEADKAKASTVKEKMAEAQKNIEKLLKDAQQNQAQVCQNIEELVRMTKYTKSKSSNSSSDDPKNGEPEQKNHERSKDKDPQNLLPQGQQPQKPEGQKPEGQKPKETGGEQKPESGEPDHTQGEQVKDGNKKPPSEKGNFQRNDVSGRWGNLPPKEAELMQSLADRQVPEKYRKLIIEFYRRTREPEKKP